MRVECRFAALAMVSCALIGSGSARGEDPGAGAGEKFASGDFRGAEFCGGCHPQHYQEWRGSAHAYATLDPLFLACNRKAHEDTQGDIGGLCVGCHAPLIARTGELPADFTAEDLSSAPAVLSQGVTCEVCHRMTPSTAVQPVGNASFELSRGNHFFGRLHKPESTAVHGSMTSEFLGQSAYCGSCHDVLHDGATLEKTFVEWSGSKQRKERELQCQNCHMLPYSGQAARGGKFRETLHRHNFPGVSVPLMKFPNRGLQSEEITQFLRTAARMTVLVPEEAAAGRSLRVTVLVKNSGAGHNLPSGISTFRQMWLEVTATDAAGAVVFRSGHRDENDDLLDDRSISSPGADEQLVAFADRFLDEHGKEVLFVWEAAALDERSLRPLEERSAVYKIPLPASLAGSTVRVQVRLLFRFFAPFGLRAFGLDRLVDQVPVWELDRYRSPPLRVLTRAPRQRLYRVPGDFDDLQTACDRLEDGDRVLVGAGEYEVPVALDFRGKALDVRSVDGPSKTILRLEAGRTDSVVVFRSEEPPGARLEGFTITGGGGTLLDGLRRGGGVYVRGASPTIVGNIFLENSAAGGVGGGLCLERSAATVEGNVFLHNWAERGGALAYNFGGDRDPWVSRANRAEGNVAAYGGGLYFEAGARARLERFVLAGNHAFVEGGAAYFGDGASCEIDRGTLYSNRARAFGALGGEASGVLVSNSIVWSNLPFASEARFRYSLCDRAVEGPGNLGEFPLFLDPTALWEAQPAPPAFVAELTPAAVLRRRWPGRWIGGIYSLLGPSPAVDTGDPASTPDPDDTRADMGAYFLEHPLKAFIRGDVDLDGTVTWADLGSLTGHLILGTPLRCRDAADLDDQGSVGPLDALALGLHLLNGGIRPAAPFPACGLDPTFGEGLSCEEKGDPCVASGGETSE